MLANQLIINKNSIVYKEENVELNHLIPNKYFDELYDEIYNSGLEAIENIYENVRSFKCYSKIIYSENMIGIEANSELMGIAKNKGMDFKINSVDGLDFLLLNENTIAIFEDDDDGDPDTGFFYFIGKV